MNIFIIVILILIHSLSAEDSIEFIKDTDFSSDINRWFIFSYLIRNFSLQLVTIFLTVYLAYDMEKSKG